mmetsp:Transcript_13826/g.16466  ORF Transcript_13826/g.16466 Transcript_13826/m.16466 type:complete len:233 (+) Transcript_13826:75-773(+)
MASQIESKHTEAQRQHIARDLAASREIRAFFNDTNDTIRVYQAYNDAIADAAVAANSFQGPLDKGLWSPKRMSWIKPSAVWMGYRCGWTIFKDRNQARVLALDVSRQRLFQEFMKAKVEKGPKSPNDDGTMVIQWDPEREIDIDKKSDDVSFTTRIPLMRSIQIGLRGGAILLDPNFVIQITDVTPTFAHVGQLLGEGNPQEAVAVLWPDEKSKEHQLEIPQEVRDALGMRS